jgi:hypothetical protein
MPYKNAIQLVIHEEKDHISEYNIEDARKELRELLGISNDWSLDDFLLTIIDHKNIENDYILDILRERLLDLEGFLSTQ